MNDEASLKLIESVLDLEPGCVSAGTQLADLAAWDSMGMLSLIVAVDRDYGVVLSADELATCSTIGDLMRLMQHAE